MCNYPFTYFRTLFLFLSANYSFQQRKNMWNEPSAPILLAISPEWRKAPDWNFAFYRCWLLIQSLWHPQVPLPGRSRRQLPSLPVSAAVTTLPDAVASLSAVAGRSKAINRTTLTDPSTSPAGARLADDRWNYTLRTESSGEQKVHLPTHFRPHHQIQSLLLYWLSSKVHVLKIL